MLRSFSAFLAVLLLLSTVLFGAACGGGGGPTPKHDGDDSDNAVVALVAIANTDAPTRALLNTVAGETLVVRALVVDQKGVGRLVSVSNLRTNAPTSVATVNASAGTITAVGSSTALYTVTGRAAGSNLSTSFAVSAAGTRISTSGLVRLKNLTAVPGATVQFLSSSGVVLASTISGSDGRFQANVPAAATQFSVDVTTLKDSSNRSLYYSTYAYGTASYEPSFPDCATPLPSPFNGGELPFQVALTRTGVEIPDSPSGCTIPTS